MSKLLNKNNFTINVAANFLGRIWSMLSVFIFIPLYIGILGEEAYGLITFYATLSSAMGLLGLGLSNTLRREFASGEEYDQMKLHKYQILRSAEFIYLGVGLLIISICFFGAELIANKWLNIGSLGLYTVTFTIRLMGVSIAFQLLANMYSGCLFGLEHQVMANIYQVIWSLAKNLGVISLLLLIARDIRLFYTWHIITDICYSLVLRYSVIKLLNCSKPLKWRLANLSNLKDIWKFAVGLLLVSLVATLNTQLDKLVISKYMSLVELGAYNIAYSLSLLTAILATAIGTAAFSKFTMYYTTNNIDKLKSNFIMFNKLAGMTVIAIGSFIAMFSNELILVWTRNEAILNLIKSSSFYVIIGSLFSSLQILPYQFMLSQGNTKVNNVLGISSIPYILVVTPYLIRHLGIFGAAISWCVLMTISTCIYLSYIHSKYIGSGTLKWLVLDTLLPFVFSLVMAYICRRLTIYWNFSTIKTILLAVILGGFVLLLMYLLFDNKSYLYIKERVYSIINRTNT